MDPEEQRDTASKGGRAPHSRRGFQAMDPEKQREIASQGGRLSRGGRSRDESYYYEEQR